VLCEWHLVPNTIAPSDADTVTDARDDHMKNKVMTSVHDILSNVPMHVCECGQLTPFLIIAA
jgi:hypothetical protein